MESEPYIIVEGDDLPSLRKLVNVNITQGYKTEGGVAVVHSENFGKNNKFFQAMIKIPDLAAGAAADKKGGNGTKRRHIRKNVYSRRR